MSESDKAELRFGDEPLVLPVVHRISEDSALRNAELAAQAGADGIFVIDHDSHEELPLFETHARIKAELPQLWAGINCLHWHPRRTFEIIAEDGWPVDGVWSDVAGIRDDLAASDHKYPREVMTLRAAKQLVHVQYFGGVAMKGVTYEDDPEVCFSLAQKARGFMDVITTSGVGTGRPANPEKIERMKAGFGGRLAIASGISADNIADYPGADAFIVGTSIEVSWGQLDQLALGSLMMAVKGRN